MRRYLLVALAPALLCLAACVGTEEYECAPGESQPCWCGGDKPTGTGGSPDPLR